MNGEDLSASGILCEFLQVAIHGILYLHELYPLGAFERKRKYNIPIQMCTHPAVAKYIEDIIGNVKRLLDVGSVHQVVIVILDHEQTTVQKFVIEIGRCMRPTENYAFDELFLLEQSLRGALLKLYVCNGLLSRLPPGCTWSVEIHTKRSALLEIQDQQLIDDMMWMLKEESDSVSEVNSKIIPLKSVCSDFLTVQLFVQEFSVVNP